MKRLSIWITCLVISYCSLAQNNDAVWLLGYGDTIYAGYGGTKLVFDNNTIDTFRFQLPFWLSGAPSLISDNVGELVTYTNGNLVAVVFDQDVANGDFDAMWNPATAVTNGAYMASLQLNGRQLSSSKIIVSR